MNKFQIILNPVGWQVYGRTKQHTKHSLPGQGRIQKNRSVNGEIGFVFERSEKIIHFFENILSYGANVCNALFSAQESVLTV